MQKTTSKPGAARNGHHADLSPLFVRLLVSRAWTRGLTAERLTRGLGLEPLALDAPGLQVSYRQSLEVARRFWNAVPGVEQGLRFGGQANIVALGALGLGMMACANIHDMLQFLIEFQRAGGCLLSVYSERTEQHFHVVVEPRFDDPEVEPFLTVYTLASITAMVRQVLGTEFHPLCVQFALPRPADISEFEQAFGCRVEFESGAHLLSLSPQATALRTAEAGVVERMRALLLEAWPPEPGTDLGAAVVQILRRSQTLAPPLSHIAAALDLGERTLRRRLAEEGLTYRGLVTEERRRRTLTIVCRSTQSMEDVAVKTGYSSARSLRRAVQRWTGSGPSLVRAA
ncbi:AraC family transcriptional regulator ligand-binding domain-containing protein, partial [Paracidovorax cattleyae]|uniref:AraC family transcriptional regulator ligand-binding domain-containing protein n=1 Tax=Paracidovorax cattleyae TaxID=80868 RepID=UPI0018AF8D98